MKKGYKAVLGILLAVILLVSLAAVSFAATQTARTAFGYGLRLRAGNVTFDAVAKLLGLKPEDVRTQRLAGKSLVDIAKDKGVDTEELKGTILESRKALLQEKVKQGAITQEQADAILKQMESRISFCLETGGGAGGCGLGAGAGCGAGFGRGGMMGFGVRGGRWQTGNVQ